MKLFDKVALIRVDFNVPIQSGVVLDDTRIKVPLDMVRYLQSRGAKVVLLSHLGKTAARNEAQSLRQLIPCVEKIYGNPVRFIDDCLAENAREIIKETSRDQLILLENLRFHPEEEKCDMNFAEKLSSLGDFFVNEAFSVSHRKHASIYGIPHFVPSILGQNFEQEIQAINIFFSQKDSPKMGIIGGSKLATKINLLKSLVKKVDKLALGGGIAGAFLAYLGSTTLKIFNPGEYAEDVKEVIKNAKDCRCELVMPIDFSALISDGDPSNHAIISSENEHASVFDIGPKSVELFKKHIEASKMVLWNGPLGLFERDPFDFGTRSVAEIIAERTQKGQLVSIIGGGDTSFAMKRFNLRDKITYVSTAGGAFINYVENGTCPALMAIRGCKHSLS